MPRTTLALTSFVSGELGAKLDGRTDFAKYSTGAKTLENFLVHPQGAATRRVGTQFIAEVKSSSAKTRLIPPKATAVFPPLRRAKGCLLQARRKYKSKRPKSSGDTVLIS